jgi:hypothetical protein
VKSPPIDLSFQHHWHAEILPARPVILPARHFTYPNQAEEVERGALEVLVHTNHGGQFLATCALGFRDPAAPTGLWSTPKPEEICAVSGGYTYLIDTAHPDRFTMLPYRPVLHVRPVPEHNLLLFVGHHAILAWSVNGEAWQSPKLSDEGVTITGIEAATLRGMGWNLMKDEETSFALDLASGRILHDRP